MTLHKMLFLGQAKDSISKVSVFKRNGRRDVRLHRVLNHVLLSPYPMLLNLTLCFYILSALDALGTQYMDFHSCCEKPISRSLYED